LLADLWHLSLALHVQKDNITKVMSTAIRKLPA